MNGIKKARQEDATAISSFDEIAMKSKQRRTFVQNAIRSGNAWVTLVNNEVVGYVVLEYTFYSQGFISMLYVHPEHRHKGIGAALMRHMETICRTQKLFTSTNQSNLPMQSLLEKLNFRPSGRIENLDEGDPELVFFKHLQKTDNQPGLSAYAAED
jgi:ribosomal protein S18 acetylase RimI-like enzyme